ncbi:MAG: hypothetical protein LBE12_13165 [Planctomycetaceae bacterium]|jgi:hypothetical protein|nr:hypothetical protein [Planctomycetaceae bacterium]
MKKFFYFIVFFLGITFSCFLCYSKEYTAADIERIERRVIEYREQIKNWHVRLSLTDEFIDSESGAKLDPVPDMKFAGNLECYKDGELLHEERGYFVNDTNETYLLKTIFNKKWRYMFGNDKIRREGSDVDIPILNMMAYSKAVGGPYTTPYDIRALGITPGVDIRFNSDTLTAYIGNPQRSNLMMSDDMIGDKKCYKISFSLLKHPEENVMSIWICPELGYNPLKFEIEFPDLKTINYYKGRQNGIFDIEVSNNNNKKIWFPKKISCRAMHGENLDKLISSATLAIEVVSFNKPLDPKLFDDRGLDLPVGTLVLIDPEPAPDTYTWDGEKIVGLSGATLEPIVIPPRNNAFRYFLIAAGLALISVACLFKYFELRKK